MSYIEISQGQSLTYSSSSSPILVDLTNVNTMLEITLLIPNDLAKKSILTGESVILGSKTFYTTDFVSITNFNVPDPVPLVFLERWAG